MENNIDKNTMDNIKNMVDSGNIAGAISQIPPDLIQNFSKMLSNQNNSNSQNFNNNLSSNLSNTQNGSNSFNSSNNNLKGSNNVQTNTSNGSNTVGNLNNIDANTIKNISAMLGKMGNSSNGDPRANLLNSLKPYLRDSKKNQLDNYMNLLNVAKIAEIINKNNSENKK